MKSHLLGKTLPVIIISMALGIGISAYNRAEDKKEAEKISDLSMEESIYRTLDDTQDVMSGSWSTTKVNAEPMANNLSKGFDVKVMTKDGVVTLEGTLEDQDAVDHVSDLAAGIKGVSRVDASNQVAQN